MRDVFVWALVCVFLSVTAKSQSPVVEADPGFLDACAKLERNPEEAASDFDELLRRFRGSEDQKVLLGKLAESRFRARKLEELLEGFTGVRTDNEVSDFWVACGLQQAGRLTEAIAVFDDLSQRDGFVHAREARQSLARALVTERKHEVALAHFAALLDSRSSPELRMEAVAVALLAGRVRVAANWLEEDLPDDHPLFARRDVLRCFALAHQLDWTAVEDLARSGRERVSVQSSERQWLDWWHAHALFRLHRITEAVEKVTLFIERPESSDWLEHGFALLEVCKPRLNSDVSDALNRWKQGPGSLGSLARFYSDLWFGEAVNQEEVLRAVVAEEAHPARQTAQLRLAERAFNGGNFEEGFELLESLQSSNPGLELADRAAFVEAKHRFEKEQFGVARKIFLTWPFVGDRYLGLLSQFNAGLIALANRNQEGFQSGVEWLRQWKDDLLARSLAWELEKARAFNAASTALPQAEGFLVRIAEKHPDEDTRSRARLALAEWYVVETEGQWAESRRWLDGIPAGTDVEMRSRRTILGLLIENWDTGIASSDLAKRMRQALIGAEPNPETALLRLTLGRLLLSQKEDKTALTVLLEGRLEDRTLFPAERDAIMLGGTVALRLGDPVLANHAVTALGEIVSREGPAAGAARLLQARTLFVAGSQREAIAQLDYLIEHAAENPGLADQARLFKGEWLVRQSGASGNGKGVTEAAKVSLEQALALWAEICESDKASAAHRQEGWYRRGRCFEILQKPRQALEAYFQGVETIPQVVPPGSNAERPGAEAEWYFRCGFRALTMLEAENRWESAILLAERLANGKGDSANQAQIELNRLRLKHYEL